MPSDSVDSMLISVKIRVEGEGLNMTKDDRKKIKIDRKKETRTKEISKMISEGGLGARNYYDIQKNSSSPDNDSQDKQERKKDNK